MFLNDHQSETIKKCDGGAKGKSVLACMCVLVLCVFLISLCVFSGLFKIKKQEVSIKTVTLKFIILIKYVSGQSK